jgi:hypothetical protein
VPDSPAIHSAIAVVGQADRPSSAAPDPSFPTPDPEPFADPAFRAVAAALLAACWHACEAAGIDPLRYSGRIGLFAPEPAAAAEWVRQRLRLAVPAVTADDSLALAIAALADEAVDLALAATPGTVWLLAREDEARALRLPLRARIAADGANDIVAHLADPPGQPPVPPPPDPAHPFLLLLSALGPAALAAQSGALAAFVSAHPHLDLAAAAFTLQIGRHHFVCRRYVLAANHQDLIAALAAPAPPQTFADCDDLTLPPASVPAAADAPPAYKELCFRCAEAADAIGLSPADRNAPGSPYAVFRSAFAHAGLLLRWGLRPRRLRASGPALYAAAAIAGLASVEDALAACIHHQPLPPPLSPSLLMEPLLPLIDAATGMPWPGDCLPGASASAANAPGESPHGSQTHGAHPRVPSPCELSPAPGTFAAGSTGDLSTAASREPAVPPAGDDLAAAWTTWLTALGNQWLTAAEPASEPNWEALYAPAPPPRIALPTYPFAACSPAQAPCIPPPQLAAAACPSPESEPGPPRPSADSGWGPTPPKPSAESGWEPDHLPIHSRSKLEPPIRRSAPGVVTSGNDHRREAEPLAPTPPAPSQSSAPSPTAANAADPAPLATVADPALPPLGVPARSSVPPLSPLPASAYSRALDPPLSPPKPNPRPAWADPGGDLALLLAAVARRNADREAVICDGQRWTYRQFDLRARQLAAYLRRLGLRPGDRVALALPRSLDLAAAMLAVVYLGAAYVPCDGPERPPFPIAGIVAILTAGGAPPRAARGWLHVDLCRDAAAIAAIAPEDASAPRAADPAAPAAMLSSPTRRLLRRNRLAQLAAPARRSSPHPTFAAEAPSGAQPRRRSGPSAAERSANESEAQRSANESEAQRSANESQAQRSANDSPAQWSADGGEGEQSTDANGVGHSANQTAAPRRLPVPGPSSPAPFVLRASPRPRNGPPPVQLWHYPAGDIASIAQTWRVWLRGGRVVIVPPGPPRRTHDLMQLAIAEATRRPAPPAAPATPSAHWPARPPVWLWIEPCPLALALARRRRSPAPSPLRILHLAENRAAASLPALAGLYLAHLRRVQPRGPYSLAGAGSFGLIALEVAHQLRRAGESVAGIALYQTLRPDFWRSWPPPAAWLARRAAALLAAIPTSPRWRLLRAAAGYTPPFTPGPVHLFSGQPAPRWPGSWRRAFITLGWTAEVLPQLCVHPLPAHRPSCPTPQAIRLARRHLTRLLRSSPASAPALTTTAAATKMVG